MEERAVCMCVCVLGGMEGGGGERGDGGGWGRGGSGWFTQTELELDKLTVLSYY